MKIKIISMMGLLLVPTISLGTADTMSRGDEAAFQFKGPVGKAFDTEDSEVEFFNKGYEGDQEQESDEGTNLVPQNMRSSAASTPDPEKKTPWGLGRADRKKFTEALKEKAKKTMGAFKSRMNDSGILSESEEDSDYDSRGSRTDQSLSPVNAGEAEFSKMFEKWKASGKFSEEQMALLKEDLSQKVKTRSSSVPAQVRQNSDRRQARFERRKARSDNRHDRPFGGHKNESDV